MDDHVELLDNMVVEVVAVEKGDRDLVHISDDLWKHLKASPQ